MSSLLSLPPVDVFPIKFDPGLFVSVTDVRDEAVEVPGRFWDMDDTARTCVFGAVLFAVAI